MQGESPPVQIPTAVYMITCRFSSCKTGVYNVRLLIILEKECSNMYRKKESSLSIVSLHMYT